MSSLTLRLRLFGIPIVVEPGFWLMSVVLGVLASRDLLLVWVIAVFTGVLVHELGHGLMAKAFGGKPEIVLHTMGGVTRSNLEPSKQESRLALGMITAAGPGAGFVLGALAFVWLRVTRADTASMQAAAALVVIWINVGWGILNLMPVFPLDGAQLVRAFVSGPGPEVGFRRTLRISVYAGIVVTIVAAVSGWYWAAFMFGWFSAMSLRRLREMATVQADRDRQLDTLLVQAREALEQGRLESADRMARHVMDNAQTLEFRYGATRMRAVICAMQGRAQEAYDLLERLPPEQVDPLLLGGCLLMLDRPEEALGPLQRAWELSGSEEAMRLLEQAKARVASG